MYVHLSKLNKSALKILKEHNFCKEIESENPDAATVIGVNSRSRILEFERECLNRILTDKQRKVGSRVLEELMDQGAHAMETGNLPNGNPLDDMWLSPGIVTA